MNCSQCGRELADAARFCGACGQRVAVSADKESSPPAPDLGLPQPSRTAAVQDAGANTPVSTLCERLRTLADRLAYFDAHPAVVEAVAIAAAGPGENRPITVVLGEKGRGKTTLVNRLLGQPVLPTGRKGFHRPVPIRFGSAWRAVKEDQETEPTPHGPPFDAADGPVLFVEGPAALLRQTTLIDAPGMNDADGDFDDVIIGQALRADLLVFCLSAAQLLSESERVVIRQRLLPVTSCEFVLTVTHMDAAPSADERQEIERRVRRFVERTRSRRLSVVFLAGGNDPAEPAPELEQVIVRSVEAANPEREKRWAGRILAVLNAVQQGLSAAPECDGPIASPTHDPGAELLCVLEQEHRMALQATEVWLRSRLAQLRLALPERFAGLSPEAMRHEGAATLTGEIQSLSREATAYFLAVLERELTSLPGLKTAAEGLSRSAAERFGAVRPVSAVELSERTTPSGHGKTAALAAVGVLLLAALPVAPLIPAASAAALTFFAAHRVRRMREVRFTEDYREDAAAAVREWLAAVEGDLLAQLRPAAEELLGALRQRVVALLPTAPPSGERPTRAELQTLLRHSLDGCRAVLAQGEHR